MNNNKRTTVIIDTFIDEFSHQSPPSQADIDKIRRRLDLPPDPRIIVTRHAAQLQG
jgi:hypothetical protein